MFSINPDSVVYTSMRPRASTGGVDLQRHNVQATVPDHPLLDVFTKVQGHGQFRHRGVSIADWRSVPGDQYDEIPPAGDEIMSTYGTATDLGSTLGGSRRKAS